MSDSAAPHPQSSSSNSFPGWRSIALCLGIAVGASVVSVLAYTPHFYAWRALGNYIVHRAPEYSRANALLLQVQDPWSTRYDPLHHVLAWRMLFPVLWHYTHLPPRAILAMPHVGCVAALWLVAWLTYRSLQRWTPTILGTLLFATLPWFFVSSGWLGYFDSWYVLGLVATAFVPSRWALGIAALLTPWVDERFLLALPVTLFVREASLHRLEERAWRDALYDVVLAIAGAFPYLAARAIFWLQGDADSQTYIQAHALNLPDVVPSRFLAGLWSGYRAGWLLIGLGLWIWARRAGWKWGATLILTVVATAVGGLFIATDMSRTVMMICPTLVWGVWLWEASRPMSQAWLLPAVVAANFLLPATHELWFSQFTIGRLPAELANLRETSLPGLEAANLIVEAESLLAQGQIPAARAKLDEALSIDDTYAVAYAHRAAMHINEKDLASAAVDAAEAVRLDPTMPYAYYLRGYISALRGDRAAAYEDLRKAVGYGGPNWNKRNEALRLLEQIAPPQPTDVPATP
jgi:tetratricopeptide (TPR) repeat protein